MKDNDKNIGIHSAIIEDPIKETNEVETNTLLKSSSSSDRRESRFKNWNLIKKHLPDIQPLDQQQQFHEVYTELEELHINEQTTFHSDNDELSRYEWRVASRWIKYEQSIDTETLRWSEPFVGALIYQNLIYLKTTLQYSTVILNSNLNSYEDIVEEVVGDFIDRGYVGRDNKELLKSIILSQHRSEHSVAVNLAGQKVPLSELYSSNYKHSRLQGSHSYSENLGSLIHFRKSSSFYLGSKMQKNKSDEFNHVNEMNSNGLMRQSAKFSISSEDNLHLGDTSHPSTHSHLNLRTSIHHLKNTLRRNTSHLSKIDCDPEVESFLIMVGVLPILDRPVMAFVRLETVQFIDHLVDFKINVKFLFIFLGPKKPDFDYREVGRCMGVLMTNLDFRKCAYTAKNRQDLIRGITQFSNKSLSVILPLGDFSNELFEPMLDWIKDQIKKKEQKRTNSLIRSIKNPKLPITAQTNTLNEFDSTFYEKEFEASDKMFDPFKRTGFPFGCLYYETKHRYSKYLSDIKDGLNLHCFITFIFIFTVCFAPALCFAGILEDKTDHWFGLNELLIATSLNGMLFALFSGQPIMIFGATGPFLVFEEMLYIFCIKTFCIEFFATRIWVAIWVMIFSIIMLAFECIYFVNFVTRFTEEIFAFLIACVFLTDATKKMILYFITDPIYKIEKHCKILNKSLPLTNSNYSHAWYNTSIKSAEVMSCYEASKLIKNSTNSAEKYSINSAYPEPNIALLSVIYVVCTCCMALILKKLRRSNFFSSYIRRTISDVGILISIILMVAVDILIRMKTEIDIQKLQIPNGIKPTKYLRESWLVSPFGNSFGGSFPVWVPFAAFFPALVIFIVLFFEIELTGTILISKSRKLRKGTGFNIDLLLGSLMMVLNSFLGLPWLCAAPVRTLAHWASLTVYSSSFIPGEKPKLIMVREQRITGFMVHLAIGLCLQAKFFLRLIPVPVLFGIFLYFGIVSLSGTQLYERIKLLFIPFKHSPHIFYARGVRATKRNFFTILQIISVALLLFFKSFPTISYMFPILLVLLVFVRKLLLPKIFNKRELDQLDDHYEPVENMELIHDFYELTHLPI